MPNKLHIWSEAEVKLLDSDGYAVVADDSGAWCKVEYNGIECVLDLSKNGLYEAFCRAGAIVGQSYLISRNAQAVRDVFRVRAICPTGIQQKQTRRSK